MSISIQDAKKYIRSLGFDIDLSYERYQEALKYYTDKEDLEGLVHFMSQLQNCGGFALEIPICIWAEDICNFEEKVLRIMKLYPFVRLLSDTELEEDEYIVVYRAGELGHHFIKYTDDGEAVEKQSTELPKKFEKWYGLEDAPEAVFAVVKQEYRNKRTKKLPQCHRDMYLFNDAYKDTEDGYIITRKAKKVETFDRTLKEAYKDRNSTFIYNNKEFSLKVAKDDKELIYICLKNDILGTVCTDGETFVIELDEEKKNTIFGFEPAQPIDLYYKKAHKQQKDMLEIGR